MITTFQEINNLSDANALTLTDGSNADALHVHAGGSGDVVGPAGATDDKVALFDGVTGKLLKEGATVTGATLEADKTKLAGVEALAEVNNISDSNATDLTDAGDTSLHFHSSDRARANHTGTQLAATISDFDAEVSSNVSVAANTAKISNVDTDLSTTQTATTVDVVSSDGTDATLPQAIASGNAGVMSGDDKSKLDGVEALAEVNNISDSNATTLTGGGNADALHTHAGGSGDVVGPASAVDDNIAVFDGVTGKLIKDGGSKVADVIARANHTGTQTASTISDFDTEVGNHPDVTANTAKISNVTTNLSNTPAPTQVTVESSDGTDTIIPQAVAGGNAGVMSGADKTKVDDSISKPYIFYSAVNGSTSDPSTTSATYSTISEMSVAITPTDANNQLEVEFNCNFEGDGKERVANVAIFIDGIEEAGTEREAKVKTDKHWPCSFKWALKLSAAAHTITIRFKIDDGQTLTAIGVSRQLIVKEFKT